MLPVSDNDPVILHWFKPDLTDDNMKFFERFDVSISRTVLNTTLHQRRKKNIPATESQVVMLGPNETSYTYNDSCPYANTTLCPYCQYCFSVVSIFEFEGIPIDTSDSALTARCITTSEAGKFIMFTAILWPIMLCGST